MAKTILKTNKRNLSGKKTRFLRRQGIVPANVFGHGIDSLAVECQEADLEKVIKGGTSRIITLDVEGERGKRNVIIKNVSYHPIVRNLIHVDFYQVEMTQKMTADIPLTIKGHAPALDDKENFLDQQLNELTIECLPDKLPSSIEVDVTGLKEAGQSLTVGDLNPGEGIAFVTPHDYMIVRVAHAAKVEEEAEEEEGPVETVEGEAGASDKTDGESISEE